MKLFAKGAVAVAVALSLGVANAGCNVIKWNKDASTDKAVSVTEGAARYEGLCALDGSKMVEVDFGKNDVPAGSEKMFFRFYVLVKENQNKLTIFRATDGTNSAELKLDGGNAAFGGKTAKINVGKWNEIEVGLDAGKTSLKVNKGTAVAGTTTLVGATTKISLGKVAGTPTGKLFFDAFIASNDTAIPADASVSMPVLGLAGRLVAGDATGDAKVELDDAVRILREEATLIEPSQAVPDCDLNGVVDIADAVCALRKEAGIL